MMMVLFFFSSRRRHTRSYGDWSSDVCSSDLCIDEPEVRLAVHDRWSPVAELVDKVKGLLGARAVAVTRGHLGSLVCGEDGRSEERRVGKECGWRWRAHCGKKKIDGLEGLRVV